MSSVCQRNMTHLRQECHNSKFGIMSYWYRKKRVRTFNRCSVIMQFAELAAGEQLCHRCTCRKL